jgi:hypothetical protein
MIGIKFKDQGNIMRVVKPHETFKVEWWCENTNEEIGLFLYSEAYILRNKIQ